VHPSQTLQGQMEGKREAAPSQRRTKQWSRPPRASAPLRSRFRQRSCPALGAEVKSSVRQEKGYGHNEHTVRN
jgi:hypothetical protein